MNQSDIEFIEKHLLIELPKAFVTYMKPFPNDLEHAFANGVQTNAELFVIIQLRHFWDDGRHDYFADQPHLVDHKFVYAGDDGCGNFYCMRGDAPESNELWFWSHDPADGFSPHTKLTLSDYLGHEGVIWGDGWNIVSSTNPFDTTPNDGKVLSRATHPFRSVMHPITLREWLSFVDQSPLFELDERVTRTNPFTQQSISLRAHPGRVKLVDERVSIRISYSFGALTLHCPESSNSSYQTLMRHLALTFNATVF